jgi:coatomer subunit alpha
MPPRVAGSGQTPCPCSWRAERCSTPPRAALSESQRLLAHSTPPPPAPSPHLQEARFNDASALCDTLFATIPLAVVATRAEAADIKATLANVTEYKMAVRLVIAAKTTDPADVVRQMELSAYTTHCALDNAHVMLVINLAMAMSFKHKNFITATGFAKRLLEMPDINSAAHAQILQRAKAVMQKAAAEGRNAHKLNYDEAVAFKVCAATLTPIYRGAEAVRSPYSGAWYHGEAKGSVCVVDGMAQVGLETVGLVSAAVSGGGGSGGGGGGGGGGGAAAAGAGGWGR